MSTPSFARFRSKTAIAAAAVLAGAALVLASLLALQWLARLSFACPRLPLSALAPPHASPWRVGRCATAYPERPSRSALP